MVIVLFKSVAHSTAAKKVHRYGHRWSCPITDQINSVDIILCCCLILFAYIHEQQKMTRLIKVLSSTNTAVAVAGLEMPNLLQTQKSEEAKDHSWCNDKTMMPLH